MSTTRAQVASLFTPIFDEFMLQEFKEADQVMQKLYTVVDDHTSERKYNDISGLGEWVPAEEGEGGGFEDPTLGYDKTLAQSKFWKKFQVSFEAVDQDEYFLLKKEGEAREMGKGARMKVEKDAASNYINGFSVTGPDGQFIFDVDHPKNRDETGTTFDNLLSGPFSHDNLELAETQIADNFFTLAGIPIEPSEKPVLLYAPALRGDVFRLLTERGDNEQPDTTMRNKNRFVGAYEAIEWRYLQAALGGSDTAWYITFPELKFAQWVYSARPHFTSWIDDDLEFFNFKGRTLYSHGFTNYRVGFGSTGL